MEEHRDTIEDLPSQEKDEYIQDLVIYQEVMSDNEYNPITKRVAQIRGKIDAISGSTSWKEDYRTYEEPELPELDGLGPFSSAESLTARLAAMSRVESVRCVCTLSYPEAGEISDVAWMRNVGAYSQSLSLVQEIAELLARNKLLRLLRKRATRA